MLILTSYLELENDRRSKRRSFLTLTFIVKSVSKNLFIHTFFSLYFSRSIFSFTLVKLIVIQPA